MVVINTICRWSYKTQSGVIENTKFLKIIFQIPKIDAKVIPFKG